MKPQFPKAIRKNITYVTVVFTLVLTLSVASISYYMFNSLLSNSLVQSTSFNLHLISETIASQISPIVALSRWSSGNTLLAKYLESSADLKSIKEDYILLLQEPPSEDRSSGLRRLDRKFRETDAANKPLALSAWNRLQEEFRNNRSSVYVSRIIVSNNSDRYLQLTPISGTRVLNVHETITQLPYFQSLYSAPSPVWIGLVADPFSDRKGEQMIPIIRPVYSFYGKKEAGWFFMSISTDLLTASLKNYAVPASSELFLTIGSKTYRIEGSRFTEMTPEYTVVSQKNTDRNTTLSVVKDAAGRQQTVVTVASSLNGWSFSQTLSSAQFDRQQTLYIFLVLLSGLIVLSLGLCLTYYLNRQINKPLAKLYNKIKLIARGDFSRDPEIEWQNELGEIGHGINTLATDVVQLMDKRIEDEKEKNDLEYQMLQSQINPHFLYNTLNSIKWMATIQNAGGIAEMTTCLARLMKTVSKNSQQMHTIREELALLGDYFLIQKYRYGGTVSLSCEVESEDLYDCRILKFTLQPMVENAIFHGIEPKRAMGSIEVRIRRGGGDRIHIDIRDDGVGMTDEQIEKVLSGEADMPSDFFKRIGINNVNRRIRYAFGPEYGLSITSRPGVYTLISIVLPYTVSASGPEGGGAS
jgi:two-component system sensor histidine kinase YesM